MKHLLSLVAALLLALPGTARASQVTSTTASPNPSGSATCTGTNPDGSTATWSAGGDIYFTSDYNSPPAHLEDIAGNVIGYHNIKPASGNPYVGEGSTCNFTVNTSNDVQEGCPISVLLKITYNPYEQASQTELLGRFSFPAKAGVTHYTPTTLMSPGSINISFDEMDDVNYVQYKVCSDQRNNSGYQDQPSYLGVATTPNL